MLLTSIGRSSLGELEGSRLGEVEVGEGGSCDLGRSFDEDGHDSISKGVIEGCRVDTRVEKMGVGPGRVR